jgi:hypothetical protein
MGFGAGPEWDERAGALARALLGGDYAGVRQMLQPAARQALTAERLGQMRQLALAQIGEPGPVTVSCRHRPRRGAARVTTPGEVPGTAVDRS